MLLLPVATQVEVPSLGPQTLADLPNEGDDELLHDDDREPARREGRRHDRDVDDAALERGARRRRTPSTSS